MEKFVDVQLNINVSFASMTMDQYKRLESFFNRMSDDLPINNEELIKFLSLDKRPIKTASIKSPRYNTDELIGNAEINLIC
jgi:hypothetical protein